MPQLRNQFTPDCPFCRRPCEMMDGKLVYPLRKDWHGKRFYVCTYDDARVMIEDGTLRAMGTPAQGPLRADREFVGNRLSALAKAKSDRDGVSLDRALELAWEWASDVAGRTISNPEEIDDEDAERLVPHLRKFQ